MQTNPTLRRTSVYTLRVQTREQVDALAAVLSAPISDHGDLALSWRDTDDASATAVATAALSAAGITGPATLTTGLGVARRTVAVQDPEDAPEQGVTVTLATGGEAFRTEDGTLDRSEVARLLRLAADRIAQDEGVLLDANGNTAGGWTVRGEA